MAEADYCVLCSRSKREHDAAERENAVHHRFAGVGGTLEHVSGEKIPAKNALPTPLMVSGPPSDAVLRTILLEKGVITLEDVEKAEKLLKATGVIRTHGHSSS